MPAHQFSSKVLQQGVVTGFHRDSNNAEISKKLRVTLNPVQGLILWVEEYAGETQCPIDDTAWGTMLCSPALLNPRARHCTVVSEGMPQNRFVVIAYLIRHHERLSQDSTFRHWSKHPVSLLRVRKLGVDRSRPNCPLTQSIGHRLAQGKNDSILCVFPCLKCIRCT